MRRTFVYYIVATVVSALCHVPALADTDSVKQFDDKYDKSEMKVDMLVSLLKDKGAGRDTLRMYLLGALEGIEWANRKLNTERQPRLFCPPPALALNEDNAADVIATEYSVYRAIYQGVDTQKAGRPILPLLLLTGLERTFPCK